MLALEPRSAGRPHNAGYGTAIGLDVELHLRLVKRSKVISHSVADQGCQRSTTQRPQAAERRQHRTSCLNGQPLVLIFVSPHRVSETIPLSSERIRRSLAVDPARQRGLQHHEHARLARVATDRIATGRIFPANF